MNKSRGGAENRPKKPGKPPQYLPIYRVLLARDGRTPSTTAAASPKAAARVFRKLIGDVPHEEMWVLLVDALSRITGAVRVSMGGASGTAFTPADVLRPAIAHAARGIILGHNHPSGDPTPSPTDIAMTAHLKRACDIVDVHLLEHIVVTRTGAFRVVPDRVAQP